jgi:transcriptional regulator with XRE-family HTH domain
VPNAVEQAYYDKGIWVRQSRIVSAEMELFGARIRRGRQQLGMSQRKLAERAGVSQSEVSRLERGMGGGISSYRLVRIGIALGPTFPFGSCPHHTACAYPYDPRSPAKPETLVDRPLRPLLPGIT